ncbi:MAG: T9SS type A sorting domain-containing protein [Bacteroidetes bacterium]|nr:T9SS type A sorting domain-containing protein [Bacteroidota bacterium]
MDFGSECQPLIDSLAQGGPVRLVVYDVLGREVAVLVDEVQPAGAHDVAFDGTSLPSGAYVYRLRTAEGQFSRTMLLAK